MDGHDSARPRRRPSAQPGALERSPFILFFIGLAILIGAVLGGYMPHGNIEVLWQPLEIVIIVGGASASFIIANPPTVIIATLKSLPRVLAGPPHDKASYLELLRLLYALFRLTKKKGMLGLESHAENPDESSLFTQFPTIMANRYAVTFLCDYLRLLTMGTENPHEVEALIDEEIETHHAEISQVAQAVATVGEGLPAFGIVAAVLGVITTMANITQPPEILGGLIGGALVGTFLGILLAYGLVMPIGHKLKAYAEAETKYFHCIKAGLIAFMQGYAPALAVEFARKTLFSTERPSFYEVEEAVEAAPAI